MFTLPQHIKNRFDTNITLRISSNYSIILNVTEDQIQIVDANRDAYLVVKSHRLSTISKCFDHMNKSENVSKLIYY